MKISKLFYDELFFNNYEAKNKKDVLKKLSSEIVKANYGSDEKAILKAYLKREKEFSTGIGHGIAIPHVRISEISKPAIMFVKPSTSIKWGSLDGNDVKYIFMIMMPSGENAGSEHLSALAELSRNFMKKEFQDGVSKVENLEDLKKLFD